MSYNKSYVDQYENTSIFNATTSTSISGAVCAGTTCLTDCTCKSGWTYTSTSGKISGTDYIPAESNLEYAALGNQKKTCYKECTYTDSSTTTYGATSCPDGYSTSTTSCSSGYSLAKANGTRTKTVTTSYTSTITGCSKASTSTSTTETVANACGKCEKNEPTYFNYQVNFTTGVSSTYIKASTPTVTFTLNGKKKTETKNEGLVTFENIPEGTYTLTGEATINVKQGQNQFTCQPSEGSTLSISRTVTVSRDKIATTVNFYCSDGGSPDGGTTNPHECPPEGYQFHCAKLDLWCPNAAECTKATTGSGAHSCTYCQNNGDIIVR